MSGHTPDARLRHFAFNLEICGDAKGAALLREAADEIAAGDKAIDRALRLMREPITLADTRAARSVLTNFVVEQKKRARRAFTTEQEATR
jgi:hypothetical protein